MLALIIGFGSFLLYSNTIPNSLNLDDELIYDNYILKDSGFSALKRIFTEPYYKDKAGNVYEYRPVVLLSYFLEFSIFGRNPHVSHALNVIIFSSTCVLLFYLLLVLLRQYDFRLRLSFLIALVFAVHTLHTEAVASIKNRDELLSLLFALLAWFSALRIADTGKIALYFFFLLFFITGLFSKQTSITFSVLIPASLTLFRKITVTQLFAIILPLVLVSVVFSPVYLLYKKAVLFVAEIVFLVFYYYAMAAREAMIGFAVRAARNTVSFAVGTFRKTQAAITRLVQISRSKGYTHLKISDRLLLASAAVMAVIIVMGIFLSRRDKPLAEDIKKVQWSVKDKIQDFNQLQVTPALQAPAPAVVPTAGRRLNFVEIPLLYVNNAAIWAATSIFVLGEYLYLMFFPHPLGFYYGYGQIPLSDFSQVQVWVYLLLHVVLLAWMLYLHFRRKHLIAAYGMLYYFVSMLPLSNLVTPIAGMMAERLAYAPSLGFCIAFSYLLIYPHITPIPKAMRPGVRAVKWISYFALAFFLTLYVTATFLRNFKWKDRLTLMQHDIRHLKTSTRAHHLLATHLAFQASASKQLDRPENKKMLQQAVVHFKRALEIYPQFPYAWYDLAKTYLMLGEKENAISAYSKSTEVDTLFAPSWFEMGVVLGETGRPAEAEHAYRQAIARDSLLLEAYINLSYLYYQQGKYRESLQVNLDALRHKPASYEINVNMGRIYLKLQDINNALVYLEKAVSINRSDKGLLNMMAELYQSTGNLEKAHYYRNLR